MRGAARAAADAAAACPARTDVFTPRSHQAEAFTPRSHQAEAFTQRSHPRDEHGEGGGSSAAFRDGGPPHAAVAIFVRPTPSDLSWLNGPVSLFPAKKTLVGVPTGAGAAAEEVLVTALVAVAESEVSGGSASPHTPPPRPIHRGFWIEM
eukprot:scaffold29778_cov101-Isochrysis_galbana.AAC.1